MSRLLKAYHAFMCWLGFHEWKYGYIDNDHGQKDYYRVCRHCDVIQDDVI